MSEDISSVNVACAETLPMEKDQNNVTDGIDSNPDLQAETNDVVVDKSHLTTTICQNTDTNDNILDKSFADSKQLCADNEVNEELCSTGNGTKKRSIQCEICEETLARYTCPRCGVRTCSLPCVKEHKSRLDCNGERDKTAFVPLTEYGDRHLLNDYRFLEDAERTLYSNKKVPYNRHKHPGGASTHLNKRSKLFLTAAHKRGVLVKLMSQALSKNKVNSSYYVVNDDSLQWHIDWYFALANTLVKDRKVPETTILMEAAQKFTNFVEYPHLRKALEDHKKDRLSSSRFLLKIDGLPANTPRYFALNPHLSVAENLKGHCVTEYPTIYIAPQSDSESDFKLLTKEDMLKMQRNNARHIAQYHKELDIEAVIEEQLLKPHSDLYTSST